MACAWRRAGAPAPDPAAATPRAPSGRFEESDRYHRGRLLDALRAGPVTGDRIAAAARTDDAGRARRLADALVGEGLAEWSLGTLSLPESDRRRPY
jgi:hypothetical protein